MFADDLGSKFNAPAREAWRLVLLFILTELKRGFTQCLREKGMLSAAERAGNGNQQLQQRTSTVLENDETGNGSAAVVTTNAVHLAATTPSLQPFAAHCVAASSKSGDVMNSVANGREPEGKLAALLAGCKARWRWTLHAAHWNVLNFDFSDFAEVMNNSRYLDSAHLGTKDVNSWINYENIKVDTFKISSTAAIRYFECADLKQSANLNFSSRLCRLLRGWFEVRTTSFTWTRTSDVVKLYFCNIKETWSV